MREELNFSGAVEPVEWFVVFHPRSTFRWLSWFACGKYKHVSAFGYYPGFKSWLLYDVHIDGTSLIQFSHERAKIALAKYTDGCTIVKIQRNPEPVGISLSSRMLFHCTPAIGNLIGLRSRAITPNTLFRDIMRKGGVIVSGETPAMGALPQGI